MRSTLQSLVFAAAFLASNFTLSAEVFLVPRGSVWKYYFNGPVPTNWFQSTFDDHAWSSGPAQLGYGDGDEQTVLIDDPGFEPPGTYFRRVFTNSTTVNILTLRLLADDGAVVYLNGAEVLRQNMPAGPVSFQTLALANIETNESRFTQWGIPTTSLRQGSNIVAVEIHQHAAGGHDNSFDLELIGNLPAKPPVITILSPTNGSVLDPGDLVITTASTDADGHVLEVSFLTNSVLLGVNNTEPFSFTWEDPPPGRYILTAQARDNSGFAGSSQRIHVQIGNVNPPITMIRAPYIQCGSTTNMVVRWRTDWLTDSVVRYGTNALMLDHTISDFSATADHELRLIGLQPDTRYFYSVGSSLETFALGEDYYFRTGPTNTRPVRIWAVGDSGTGDAPAQAVRDAYYAATAGVHTDVMLMLGDNAYGESSDDKYQEVLFTMYQDLLRNTVVWPALGNHDAEDSTSGSPDLYLSLFTFPIHGEAGGLASGTGLYYSYDYANIHFVCVDSFLSDRSTNGPMLTWLRNDLAATEKDWIIAYWHHPPLSWGEHNSDSDPFGIEMRERVLPILEEYGVDLVLSGHSHVYERSFLLNGHYGYSWELESGMILDSGLGCGESGEPYRKPAGGAGSHQGAVYCVCGCSGQGGQGAFSLHPAIAINHGGYGSMMIDISGLVLTARFLRPSLAIDDCFTIDKSSPLSSGPPLQIAKQTNSILLSWPTSIPEFHLQSAPHLASEAWRPVGEAPKTIGRKKAISLPHGTNTFFQLYGVPPQ